MYAIRSYYGYDDEGYVAGTKIFVITSYSIHYTKLYENFGGFSDYLVETTGESITCKACSYHIAGEHNIMFT